MSPEVFEIVFQAWWRAFLLSLVVEGIVAGVTARALHLKVLRVIGASTAGTCLTHPLLWFVWSRLIANYALYIASGEILVAAIEALVIWAIARPITAKQAIAVSLIANGASYGLGVLIHG